MCVCVCLYIYKQTHNDHRCQSSQKKFHIDYKTSIKSVGVKWDWNTKLDIKHTEHISPPPSAIFV